MSGMGIHRPKSPRLEAHMADEPTPRRSTRCEVCRTEPWCVVRIGVTRLRFLCLDCWERARARASR